MLYVKVVEIQMPSGKPYISMVFWKLLSVVTNCYEFSLVCPQAAQVDV